MMPLTTIRRFHDQLVDEIYNLACPASPIHYQFGPVQTTKTSVHGAINMLGYAYPLTPRGIEERQDPDTGGLRTEQPVKARCTGRTPRRPVHRHTSC